MNRAHAVAGLTGLPAVQRLLRAGFALFLILGICLPIAPAKAAAPEEPVRAASAESPEDADKNGKDAAPAPKIQLFGTVEIRRPLNTLPAWLDTMERNKDNPIFTPGSRLNASTTWDDLKAKAAGLSKFEQLKLVNSFWNRWPYQTDPEAYGKPDYWAAPFEFRKNSGDCEDYSIAKYYTLRALGFPADDMRIVVVMETVRNLAHAVLVVYLDGEAYILDNLSANVLPHTRLRNYVPQYSVNENYRWAHMRPKKSPAKKPEASGKK